jgi:hypothetical protein
MKGSASCTRCGSSAAHVPCPVCEGRGCLSTRELAEKLGLRDALDATALSADAIARAVDARVLASIEATKKLERDRTDQVLAADRRRQAENEGKLRALIKEREDELTRVRDGRAEAEARAKLSEDLLKQRRQQPASVGRTAEKDFASLVGTFPDMRLSPKLAKGGDYELWVKFDVGDGSLTEMAEPLLVDVKRESAALQAGSLTKLVRDCRARGRLVGVLVADRSEEVGELFGPNRVRMLDEVLIILTSVDAFASEIRLLAPYFKTLIDARREGDEALLAALATSLSEVSQLVVEVESGAEAVAVVLERQAQTLRTTVCAKLCARIRKSVVDAGKRIARTARAPETTTRAA